MDEEDKTADGFVMEISEVGLPHLKLVYFCMYAGLHTQYSLWECIML